MEIQHFASIFALGFAITILLGVFVRYKIIEEAKEAERDILQNAENQNKEMLSEKKRDLADSNQNMQIELEKELAPQLEKIEEQKLRIADRELHLKEDFQDQQSDHNKYWQSLKKREAILEVQLKEYGIKKETLNKELQQYCEKIKKNYDIDTNAMESEIKTTIIEKAKERLNLWAQTEEEEFQDKSEKNAKAILTQVLHRFQRPYCPDKGISYVSLKNSATKNKLFGNEDKNIQLIESLCGVDLIYREDMQSISVSGFDPVRRELARSLLEKLCKERVINDKVIRSTFASKKRNLFQRIHQDGLKLFNELKIKIPQPPIINTMGSLRYRYSFAQNQYFHCAEVGHLCGLLASEVNESIKDAKRAGVLHDIGKAMDHSIDGGHAVIGADFIEKHNEASHIIHAVKAHHYDETPQTALAFLVIAADALSGARPGARRSTADAYAQKINQLQEIGNSFEGVLDTYIMSAGREVRLTIDSQKISEPEIIELSKKVTAKIEEECNYPGLIKVTIVRNTQSVAYAK